MWSAALDSLGAHKSLDYNITSITHTDPPIFKLINTWTQYLRMQGMADYGDSDLVLRGIFHNVLHIRYNDPSMTRSAIAAEWFSYVETFQAYAFR